MRPDRRLKPLARESRYAASALPALMLSTDRFDELVRLALDDDALPENDEIARASDALISEFDGRGSNLVEAVRQTSNVTSAEFTRLTETFVRALDERGSTIVDAARQTAEFTSAELQRVSEAFVGTLDGQQFIASRFVKEIGRLGGDVSRFVSPRVSAKLAARFGETSAEQQRLAKQTPPFHDA